VYVLALVHTCRKTSFPCGYKSVGSIFAGFLHLFLNSRSKAILHLELQTIFKSLNYFYTSFLFYTFALETRTSICFLRPSISKLVEYARIYFHTIELIFQVWQY
jgi:hypothetical protein